MNRVLALAQRAADGLSCLFLGALVALLPWEVLQRLPVGGLTAIKVASAGFVVAAFAQYLLAGRLRPSLRTGVGAALGLLVLAASVSTAFSQNTGASMFYLRVIVSYAVLFIAIVAHVRTPETAAAYLRVFCFSAAFGALVTVAAALGVGAPTHWRPAAFPWSMRLIDEARAGETMRLTATGMDINLGAFGCLLGFVVAFTLRPFRGAKREHWLQGALLVSLLAGIIVPQSRSALLAAGLIVAFYVLRRVANASKLAFIALFFLAMGAVVFGVWYGADVILGRGDDSISSRVLGYRAGFHLIKQYALFGTGLGASDTLLSQTELGKQLDGATIHNLPIKLWLEMGLLGLASYLLLWPLAVLRAGWCAIAGAAEPTRRLGRLTLAVLAAAFMMSLVQPFIVTPYYPVLLGILLGPMAQAAQQFRRPEAASWDLSRAWTTAPRMRAAVCGGLALFIAVQWVSFNRAASRALAASDAMHAGMANETLGSWEDAGAAYMESAEGLDRPSQWADVFALVYDLPFTFRAMALQHREPNARAVAFYGAGRAAWSAGTVELAERRLRAALELQPTLVEARYALSELLWSLGRYDEAYAEIPRIHEDEQLWQNSTFLVRMKAYDRRIAELEKKTDPSIDDIAERALRLRQRGRWREAYGALDAIQRLKGYDANNSPRYFTGLLKELEQALRAIVH